MSAPTTSHSDLLSLNGAPLLYAAQAYISKGWPVLPLVPREKRPANADGLSGASTDATQIAEWWQRWPAANIGLRTGDAFDVLDVDGKGGVASLGLSVLEESGTTKYRHPGPVQSTGKGAHLLFAPTGARNFAAKGIYSGLDFRGQRGYIVASPSIHPNGHKYRWIRDEPLPDAPKWLLKMLIPQRTTPPRGMNPDDMRPIVVTFQRVFGSANDVGPLQRIGERYITNCPFHRDDTPSFVLYPENNSFYCFGCNEWGDSIDLENTLTAGPNYGQPPSVARSTRTQRAGAPA